MNDVPILLNLPLPTQRSRRRRHQRWMRKGLRAKRAEDWPKAVLCYRRAIRICRSDPLAWFYLAESILSGGDPELAEVVACQAEDVPGMDPADLLELRAIAAWERGDDDTCEEFLRALNHVSPGMASELRAEIGI